MWGSDEDEQFWCVYCQDLIDYPHNCPNKPTAPKQPKQPEPKPLKLKSYKPDIAVKWCKWTFGVWHDADNHTLFGIDIGPLEIVWRYEGYRP